LQREEDNYINEIQNEFKNRRRTKYEKSLNREAISSGNPKDRQPEKDIFFKKSQKK